ncbi:hypothetical protein DFJ73DRAFT_584602 [Zopfochytrium polystomum]|nr:hypothetical protein DFJ73DRAFT_584602 [Zopfochytrium polystomum]
MTAPTTTSTPATAPATSPIQEGDGGGRGGDGDGLIAAPAAAAAPEKPELMIEMLPSGTEVWTASTTLTASVSSPTRSATAAEQGSNPLGKLPQPPATLVLHNCVQGAFLGHPDYLTIESGCVLNNTPFFRCAVTIMGRTFESPHGAKNMKDARSLAAYTALVQLGLLEEPQLTPEADLDNAAQTWKLRKDAIQLLVHEFVGTTATSAAPPAAAAAALTGTPAAVYASTAVDAPKTPAAQPHAKASTATISLLNEHAQKNGLPPPLYSVVRKEGPSHQPLFLVEVRLRKSPWWPGQPAEGNEMVFVGQELANTLQGGKAEAARVALEQIFRA